MTKVEVFAELGTAVEAACRAMERAHAQCRPLEISSGSPQIWALALDAMIEADKVDIVEISVPALLKAFPKLPYLQTLTDVFAQIPLARGERFVDDMSQAVQVVPRPGASMIVFAFTGLQNRLMLQLNLLHRWLAELDIHIVYLRDTKSHMFIDGVDALADGYANTVSALRTLAFDLGARRACCIGTCQGGYAALRYATDLCAERVLVYSPMVRVAPEDVPAVMQQVERSNGDIATPDDLRALDLKPALSNAPDAPIVRIAFGAGNKHDAAQANYLADLPNVILEPLPGVAGHNSLRASVSARRLSAQLAWLVQPNGAA